MDNTTHVNTLCITVWGLNDYGEEIKERDKLLCGNGLDTWYTHVQIDPDTGKWHREADYFTGIKSGFYELL